MRFQVFPNPSTGAVTLQPVGQGLEKATVELVDLSGRTIFTRINETITGPVQLDFRHLAKGSYFVRVTANNGQQVFPLILSR